MIIDCISDSHGHYPELEGGDLLIVAGDLTAGDRYDQYVAFFDWLKKQDYLKKVFICGNHDNLAMSQFDWGDEATDYLCDSGTDFECKETHVTKWGTRPIEGGRHLKLKVWGSPWTKTFAGMNPKCKAFTVDTEEELAKKWALIPDDIDILICHTPFWRTLDQNQKGSHCGSYSLMEAVNRIRPKLFVCGHIHEQGGKQLIYKHVGNDTLCVNASYVNERYQPVNKPIRITL